MAKAGAQAIITQELFTPHRVILIDLATKQHLAVMGTRETTAAGGLVSMYLQLIPPCTSGQRSMLTKSSRGTKPADLPVEQPTNFQDGT